MTRSSILARASKRAVRQYVSDYELSAPCLYRPERAIVAAVGSVGEASILSHFIPGGTMTGTDLDLAGIRARAEAATPGPWRVIAHEGYTDDSIVTDHPHYQTKPHGNHVADTGYSAGHQRQNFMNDSAHIAGMHPPTVIAMCDLIEHQAGEIARLKAEVVECKRAAVKAVVPLEAMRMAGTDKDFCPQLRDGVNDGIASVRALVTPKEDTPCRTA